MSLQCDAIRQDCVEYFVHPEDHPQYNLSGDMTTVYMAFHATVFAQRAIEQLNSRAYTATYYMTLDEFMSINPLFRPSMAAVADGKVITVVAPGRVHPGMASFLEYLEWLKLSLVLRGVDILTNRDVNIMVRLEFDNTLDAEAFVEDSERCPQGIRLTEKAADDSGALPPVCLLNEMM